MATLLRTKRKQILFFLLGLLFLGLLLSTNSRVQDKVLRIHRSCLSSDVSKNTTRAMNPFPSLVNDPIINNFTFTYLINHEYVCKTKGVEIMMPIHSAVTNFKRRKVARGTRQGKFARVKENNALMLFFVGIPSSKIKIAHKIQEQLVNESKRFKDIIQINMTDTYHSLSYKAMAVLNWISTYCSNSDVVLKMDDDVNIDTPVYYSTIYKIRFKYPHFIVGELRIGRQPSRVKKIKWYMPESDYSNSTFPPFVPGPVVGYPTATVMLLFKQALRTKIIWLDDVFITGICRQALGIPIFDDRHFKVKTVQKKMQAPHFVST